MRILTISVLFLTVINSSAQNTFFNTYGGSGNDYGEAVVCTNDYGYVIAGATESSGNGATDMYIFKIDSVGNFIWSKTFGGPNIDWATDIVKDIDTNLVFCGYSNSNITSYDIVLTKTDSAGNLIWQNYYGGSDWEFAYTMAKTKDSNYLVAGETYSYGAGQNDGYLLKINSNGDTLWTNTYGGTNEDLFYDVIECENGNIICCGKSNSYSTNGDSDFWIVYLDQLGNELWNITIGDSLNDWAHGAFQVANKNIDIIGTLTDTASGIENWWIYQVDTLGNIIWETPNIESSANQGISLIGYPNSGYTFVNAMTTAYGNGGYDLYYSLVDEYSWLNLNHTSTFGGYEDDLIAGADTTYEGAFISVGTTYSTQLGQTNVAVFLLDTNYFIPAGNVNEYNDITSLLEFEEETYKIYPNPTIDFIRIETESKNPYNVQIYSITGKQLLSKKNSQSDVIDIRFLPEGVYLLRLYSNNNYHTIKIIKE